MAPTTGEYVMPACLGIYSRKGNDRAAVSTRVLVKFYFQLQISTSGFKFCKLNYRFVAICANLDFALCTLISFNFQLHYNTNNNNEIKYCATMLTKTNNQKKKNVKLWEIQVHKIIMNEVVVGLSIKVRGKGRK